MKKSEILRQLTDFLVGADLPKYQYNKQQNMLAQEILKEIENLGMCPPFSPKAFMKQKQKWGIEAAHGNEWELENDESN